ncbi:MAG: siderophore-interacting protein [Microbacterium sp.]
MSGMFRVRVTQITDLTPSFRRFTFGGDALARYGDPGFDERIKVVFPTPTVSLERMPVGDDWYTQWRALDADARPPFRTYTTRYVRNDHCEVDVDMVVHEVSGPASRWIRDARVGDEVILSAPEVTDEPPFYGIDFVPPASVEQHLLVGDETASPAIAAILEQLPPSARGVAVVELPFGADDAYLPSHPGFEVHVSGREDGERSAWLDRTVREVLPALCPAGRGSEVEEVDVDEALLWESPRSKKGGAALKHAPLYAWLAGEAGAIKALRRHLVTEHGVDRRAVAFMGYWRLGRAEAN